MFNMKKILLLCAMIFGCLQFGFAQSDNLDTSFGNNGIVRTDLGENYSYGSSGRQVLKHADGSIYLLLQSGESYNRDEYLITKRNPDGSIDSGYGRNGFSESVKMPGAWAVLQSDGKIVLGGYIFTGYGDFDIALARFNADGNLDSTFDNDGKVLTSPFSFGDGNQPATVLYNDGKIVVGCGYGIARYNSDGSLDNTFNQGDILINNFTITGGAIQSDGKIVITGNGTIARLNAEGTPDKTFSEDGIQSLNPHSEYPTSVTVQKDGKLLVGVDSSEYDTISGKTIFGTALVRFNIDGSLDKSFSGDGKLITGFGYKDYQHRDVTHQIAIQDDGKIVVGGNMKNGSASDFTLARYDIDGSLDKTFSGDGIQQNDFEITAVAIQKEGKILTGGFVNSRFALAQYTANGTPDNTFDKDGKLTDSIRSGYTIYRSSAIQKDGKIVVAGYTWNGSNFNLVIVRYNTDGTPDNSFSSDGISKTGFVTNALAIQNDGKIVVAGAIGKNDSSFFSVARYNTNGSPDNTFNGNGQVQTDFGLGVNSANSVAIHSDGKIVVAGGAYDNPNNPERSFAVARYNNDGSLDNSFSNDGKQTFKFSYQDYGDMEGRATSVAIQSDGKIVVSGISSGVPDPFTSVARLNTDGSLDNTFGDNGKVTSFDEAISCSVAVQADGKIVMGGSTFYRGYSRDVIVRYNKDGSFDLSNGINLDFNLSNTPNNNFGNTIVIQSDGKIAFTGFALSVYNADGSFDSTFSNDGKQVTPATEKYGFINSVAIADDKLYAVGSGKSPGNVGIVARYLLGNDQIKTPPTVSITTPANNATYLAPAAHIKLSAAATDKDGTISKVEFYNGKTLLHTETVIPYGFVWRNVPLGNYTLTAKAYDNSGLVTTSAPVHISVVPNKAPAVRIIKPDNNQSFAAPGYIHFEAAASDTDGRISNVKFYNGSTLLRIEYEYPYTYTWSNVHAGTYTITAVATDNWGAHTASAPVTVRVTSPDAMIVNSKPSTNNKTVISNVVSLKLSPNPATDMVNIYTTGLQLSEQATITVISALGVVMKTMPVNGSAKVVRLDVLLLVSGVYTIKLMSGDKVLNKQFVKL
jgi:uncharacterized delta-60 repeat protein